MPTALLSSKGRITIPSAVRRSLGLNPGDVIEFTDTGNGRFVLSIQTGHSNELKGLVRRKQLPVSVEEMNAAIVDAAKARNDRT
ncbi:AbrB/MazE/SpoVT family DNA-binding domain-containing protein [Pseudomonas sp. UMAB-08]|uniref:AbrB/MazE/SpoVT family DNA-binding domain-containing protein n=1 Tax=Pseudomonas sp. UMAB-08 TaxID=1365375 RepID=UPI001C588D6C|nr:AbrB/MazE/SpoVT family DNA-binding domain-containing protein [Pseudomonas sp. UMAB-08]